MVEYVAAKKREYFSTQPDKISSTENV